MKETGIIMSGNHPKLILDGTKTQTRRVIKLRTPKNPRSSHSVQGGIYSIGDTQREIELTKDIKPNLPCPYGQVGDRLYIKEFHNLTTWFLEGEWWIKAEYRFEYENDSGIRWFKWDDIPQSQKKRLSRIKTWGKWRSSRFMYKFLARIWLEITEVRAERLQEITGDDAIKEGIVGEGGTLTLFDFSILWDSLNAKRGYSWEVNPWVWVISFKELPK